MSLRPLCLSLRLPVAHGAYRSRPVARGGLALAAVVFVPVVGLGTPATALDDGRSVATVTAVNEVRASSPALRPAYTAMTRGVSTEVVVVKFHPETLARVRGGAVVSLAGADLSAVTAIVADTPGATLAPRFPQPESVLEELRQRGEVRVGRSLPDLSLYAEITLPPAGDEATGEARLADLLAALHAAPGVALAWGEPLAEPAGVVPAADDLAVSVADAATAPADALSDLAFSVADAALRNAAITGGTPSLRNPAAGDTSATPDFSPLQGYLYAAPVGIEAPGAWIHPGGLGQGVDFIDLEWGWLFAHEDLPAPFYTAGDYGTDDHGTAVVGEVSALHNGYGVNGIAPEVRTGAISLNTYSIPGAILDAGSVLDPGDVFLMEVQCSGPENWMPCEWWQDVFDAIEVVTATGVICVEAGGNGTVNLDDALYGDLFDRRVRDSGAIVVGAGTPEGLSAEWFSNYGSRTDLNGWGSSIVTTCCGDLQGGDPEVRYTAGFNGTSGASPIVVGAIASLQGQALALFGEPLTPDLIEEILSVTGSAWTGDRQIGERPNLLAARDRLLLGFGDVTVLVRDGDTLEPLAGRPFEIAETGRVQIAGPTGEAVMQLSAGDLTFRVPGDFFYPTVEVPFTVIAGGNQSLTIDVFRAPAGEIAGVVEGDDGSVLPGAQVAILGAPLTPAVSDGSGAYSIDGVPENGDYDTIAYGVPARGVAHAPLDVAGGMTTTWNPILLDAETFEASNGGYSAGGEWEWGTPTFPLFNPPPTFSGSKVWGVNLDGPYGDLVTSSLTSPVIDASEASRALLTFHHWYWVDPDDGGQLQVWDEATNRWVVVAPLGGYPDDSIQILVWTGGYNGHTADGYVPAVFDLSPWIGGDLQFRFHFRSNVSGYKLGWYIDDVSLDLGLEDPAALDDLADGVGAGEGLRVLGAAPNPSGDVSRLAFALGAVADVSIDIHAPTGARVRHLVLGPVASGRHEVAWDGRDDRGHLVGAGTYFYIVRSGGAEASGRVVRVR